MSRDNAAQSVDPERVKISSLTEREREIVGIAATQAGANAKAIAEMLFISEHTLRNHLTSIYDKLQVANRLELFAYAHKHGLRRCLPPRHLFISNASAAASPRVHIFSTPYAVDGGRRELRFVNQCSQLGS